MYDAATQTWTNSYKTEFTYDSAGHEVLVLESEWDGTTWENDYKVEKTYNTNGKMTLRISYYYDNSAWQYDYKTELQYNSSNDLINLEAYRYDSGSWEPEIKIDTITYDASVPYDQLLLPRIESGVDNDILFNHQNNSFKYYEGSGSGWNYLADFHLFYSDHDVTVKVPEELSETQVYVYPVPANAQVYLKNTSPYEIIQVELIDADARTIRIFDGNISRFNITDLPSGIYYLRVQTTGGISMIRMQKL
jgi:hypothetical protein